MSGPPTLQCPVAQRPLGRAPGRSALQVARRLVDVLGELVDAVPPARRAPVQRRLERATGDLQRAFPDEARATPCVGDPATGDLRVGGGSR
jgi:hypothetical protein